MWHARSASKLFLLAFVVACAAATSPPRFRAALETPQSEWAEKLKPGGVLEGKSQAFICALNPKGATLHEGANKRCCEVAEGVGFCLTKAFERPEQGKDSIDREIANAQAVRTFIAVEIVNAKAVPNPIGHMRVVALSIKVSAPCTSTGDLKKKCVGFFNEWADGTFVHPVQPNDWGSGGGLCEAAKKLEPAKVTALGTAFGKLAKRLTLAGGKKIVDFQGAVLNDGTFLFADVGRVQDEVGADAPWKTMRPNVQAKKAAMTCAALGGTGCPSL